MDFSGKTIVITGAASGIGLAAAQLLAARKAKQLILVDRDAEALHRLDLDCAVLLLPGAVCSEEAPH